MRKCPSCGALVPALAVSCAECGHEFSGIEASSSAQLLSKKIEEIKKNASEKKAALVSSAQKQDKNFFKELLLSNDEECLENIDEDVASQIDALIASFPIPNAKNDLFDFILFLKNNIETESYKRKLNECIERATYLFPTDPLFTKVIADAKKTSKLHTLTENNEILFYIAVGIGCLIAWIVMVFVGKSNDWGFFRWIFSGILYAIVGGIIGAILGVIGKVVINLKYKQSQKSKTCEL